MHFLLTIFFSLDGLGNDGENACTFDWPLDASTVGTRVPVGAELTLFVLTINNSNRG